MNSTTHLLTTVANLEEPDQYFISIKEEHEPIVEEISLYNSIDLSGYHDEHRIKSSYISQLESNEDEFTIDAKSVLDYVKYEIGEEKKENVPKAEIEGKHVVMNGDVFQVAGDRTVDTNTDKTDIESIEDFKEETSEIAIKSEPDICGVSNMDCYDNFGVLKSTKPQKLNICEHESIFIIQQEAEIKKEYRDPLQSVQEEGYGVLEQDVLVKTEVIEGKL